MNSFAVAQNKHLSRPALTLACIMLLSIHAAGAEPATHLLPTRIVIPERGALTGYILATASNTVSFLPPDGWKTEKKSKQVVIAAPDLSATLTLQVFDNLWRTNAWNWAEVRREVCARVQGSRLIREIDCWASDVLGKAYDVEQTAANGSKLIRRTAIVPFQSGLVEITLTAVTPHFPDQTCRFGSLMSSLRVAAVCGKR